MAPVRWSRLTDPGAVAAILCVFWAAMLASLWGKSPTFDEIPTAAAGYTYWRLDDYRLLPEHGNLPQRLVALPLAWSGYRFPSVESDTWRTADAYGIGDQWFYRSGNDATAMVRRGRAVSGLLAVALGALVWWWSRQLFGPVAGMVSLLVCVLDPTILANGALMASDTAVAFFLAASSLAVWRVLQRVSAGRVLVCGLALGGLFLSKRSAVVIVPVVVVLLAARLLDGSPATGGIGAIRFQAARPLRRALALGGALLGSALIAWALVWASYGFRYGAMRGPGSDDTWCSDPFESLIGTPPPRTLLGRVGLRPEQQLRVGRLFEERGVAGDRWMCGSKGALAAVAAAVLDPTQARLLDALVSAPPEGLVLGVIDFARRHRLFPEAFVYGHAQIWRYSRQRGAFFDGEVSARGWKSFFPYTFLVKTPLAFLGLMVLALVAGLDHAVSAARRGRLSWSAAARAPTLPLWTVLGFYWPMAIFSHMDIGHRYILPTYPPLFILCGVVARGWGAATSAAAHRPAWARASVRLAAVFGALLACEVACRFPNYLAYFNVIAGGPARAYRHLVDSSLDWGQDLPGVKRYIDAHHLDPPLYLSYFGTASPAYYGIRARPLRSYPNWDEDALPALRIVDAPEDGPEAGPDGVLPHLPDYEVAGVAGAGRQRRVALLQRPSALRLTGGVYFVSASMLQPLFYQIGDSIGPWGPWSARYERAYQEVGRAVAPLLGEDRGVRAAALATRSWPEWQRLLDEFRTLRFARLAAFLRHREPDDNVNFSILVYRLTAAEVGEALLGPPAEIEPASTAALERP